MTKSPSEDRRTEGVDGPAYELNQVCPVPGCGVAKTLQRHHMWRKSDVIGDKWWVHTTDDTYHGNCVNLCGFHHRELTDNIARIVYLNGGFYWKDVLNEAMILTWQPPHSTSSPLDPENSANPENLNIKDDSDSRHSRHNPHEHLDFALSDKLGLDHVLHQGHDPDYCPTCLRKLPKPKEEGAEPEQKKVRKTWSCAVPLDQYEDGADVIDALLEEARTALIKSGWGYGDGKVVRYYVLTAALAMFVTHSESLMSDG